VQQQPYALWRDPLMLAIVGTLSIHLLLIVGIDVAGVVGKRAKPEPAPELEYVEVDPPEPPKPEPPPPPPEVKAPDVVQPQVAPQPQVRSAVLAPKIEAPPPETPSPEPPRASDVPTGGAQVVHMDYIAPAAHGVAVARGTPNEHVGRGGTGTGSGSGGGSGSAAPTPVSVATIKKRALPKGDYQVSGDYPEEAKQLGIEGDVRVRLVVDATGIVTGAVLLNHLGHGLDERALDQARKIAFEPARDTDDNAVASVVVWTFHFTLPKT
jgi:protein TonB